MAESGLEAYLWAIREGCSINGRVQKALPCFEQDPTEADLRCKHRADCNPSIRPALIAAVHEYEGKRICGNCAHPHGPICVAEPGMRCDNWQARKEKNDG